METEGIKVSTTEPELFEVTENMRQEMEEARERAASTIASIDYNEIKDTSYNFRDYDQAQTFFITVSKAGFIEDGHPVVIIDKIIEGLNLDSLYSKYSDEGNPAYHPKMMLKILFYAYYCRIMTSRTIWNNVINRSDFIYLSAGQVPNFRTINLFRMKHLDNLPNLFAQIVMLCKELDMIGFEHMAIDGEKIQANANFRNSKNLKQVKAELERVEKGMQKLLEQEVNEHINMAKIDKRLNTLQKKMKKLKGLQGQLEEIGDEKKRINTTDPDAPVMRRKDGTSRPAYNHQTVRDDKCGVVTAVDTTLSGDKPEDLISLVEQSIENTGEHHEKVTADSGFQSYANLEKMEERTEDFYVPDTRFVESLKKAEEQKKFGQEQFLKNGDDTYQCPNGRTMKYKQTITTPDGGTAVIYECEDCENCPLKPRCTKSTIRQIAIDTREPLREEMREKLKSDEGRETYIKRQGLIESIHGDDQKNGGWTQHLLRKQLKARGEFMLLRIAHNLRCIVKNRGEEVLAYG
ncbi:MAG: IS1182 family transposase [Thermodesulfobacteriota bacterium]|nr:IS1182 family transposase [Thermodesulfobacteriota bacterium]